MPEVELPDVELRSVVLRPAGWPAPPVPQPPQAQPAQQPPAGYPPQAQPAQQPPAGGLEFGPPLPPPPPRAIGPASRQPWPRRRPSWRVGGWSGRLRPVTRARLSARWPVLALLALLVAAGWVVGSLVTVPAGPAGQRWWVLGVAVGGLVAGVALALVALSGSRPRAHRLVAVWAAVRRARRRGGRRARRGPGPEVLSVVATARDGALTASVPLPPAVVPVQSLRAELGERISLGARSRRLTAESVLPDDSLRVWAAEPSDRREYDLVRIVCAFRPQDGERFVRARLAVRLTGPAGGPPAVVVSMSPMSEQAVANRRRVVRLGANFRLLEAGTETESSSSVTRPRLTALGTLQSTAEWHLHSPALLFGEREFLLVVERPVGGRVTCTFDVHVRIEWDRNGGGDYTAELPADVRQLLLP